MTRIIALPISRQARGPRALGGLLFAALLAAALPAAAQRAPVSADLSCLTGKQEHCLPEPMSVEEPHRAVCATCHNLWTQKTPAAAARTCASSGCHERPDTLTPFHRGLSAQVRRTCTGCHPAHDVRIPDGGTNCTFCHVEGGVSASAGTSARLVVRGKTPERDRPFLHANHRKVECTACHTSERGHGSVTMTRGRTCQSCHHRGETLVISNCATCHAVTRVASRPVRPTSLRR